MPSSPLQEVTSRDFRGGLNVSDSELNLSSKYARVLSNVLTGIDGSNEVRQGTKLFADIGSLSDYSITNLQYFFSYLIVVNRRGEIFAIDGLGAVSRIWDSVIAESRRAGLTIWSSAEYVAFKEFNGKLILMNGVDKPLEITTSLTVDYLADLATGSNINVPIGKVCTAFANHFFIADGYILHVSERNAAGTYQGDAGAQFVNNFDMRAYVTTGDTTIIGLWAFKNFLIVAFREVLVPIQIVEDATATPKLNINVAADSIIDNYGAVSPRVAQDVGDMNLSCDIVGVSSQSLSTFTKILSPDRPSRFVDPMLQPIINKLSQITLFNDVFSVWDRRLSCYTLFLPNNASEYQQYVTGFNYRYIDRLGIESWSTLDGWNWHAVARSSEGNIFYARNNDTSIFIQGDAKTNPINADFVGEQEMWDDDTTWDDQTGWSPVADVDDSGVPIKWVWEIPWSDLKHRALSKTLRHLIFDTEGDQQFKVKVFIDDIYKTRNSSEPWSDGTLFTDGTGFNPVTELSLTPALTLDLIAKDAGGYGNAPYGSSPYGGGNNTALRTLTYAPTRFTSMKLRLEGEAMGPMKFIAITLLYLIGTIRRLP
jgi:hypothetical protein